MKFQPLHKRIKKDSLSRMVNYINKYSDLGPGLTELGLKSKGKTLPNQVRKPIQTPTLRWLFYLLDDIYVLIFREGESTRMEIQGITPLKKEILQCFGETIGYFYGIK